MIPEYLKMRGWIGSHDNTGLDEVELDFTQLRPGIVALVGTSGFGKTTFMENLQPYRLMVSRPPSYDKKKGKLADHCYLRDSMREYRFRMNDDRYVSKFLIDSENGNMKAFLELNGKPLTDDGKNEAYDALCEEHFGSPDLFFSSVFRGQKVPSFATLTEADGKKLFLELIDQGRYIAYYKSACAKRDEKKKALDSPRTVLSALLEQSDDPTELEAEALRLKEGIERSKTQLSVFESFLEESRNKVAEHQAKMQRYNDRRKEKAEADAAWRKADAEVRTMRGEMVLEKQQQEAAFLEIDAQITTFDKLLDNKERIKAVLGELADKRREVATFESIREQYVQAEGEVSARIRDLEHTKERSGMRVREANKNIADLMERNSSASSQRERDIAAQRAIIARLESMAEPLKRVPCAGTDLQPRCEFLSMMVHESQGLDKEKAALVTLVENDQFEHVSEMTALTVLEVERERIQTVAEAEVSQAEQSLDAAKAVLGTIDYDASLHNACKERITQIESEKWESLWERALSADVEKAAKVQQKNDLLANIDRENKKAEAVALAAQNRADEAALRVREIEDSLKDEPETQRELDTAVSQQSMHKESIEREQAVIRAAEAKAAATEARMEDAKKRQVKIDEVRAEIDLLVKEAEEWDEAARIVGPDGLQAMNIEMAGPEVAATCNDLLGAFDCPFRMRIDTARPDSTGKRMLPTFAITVMRDSGPTQFHTLSGGQAVWVDQSLTLAVALYLRKSRRSRYGSIFLDEASSAVSPDLMPQYLRMLYRAYELSGVEYIFLITHSSELIAAIDQKIEFTKDGPNITYS